MMITVIMQLIVVMMMMIIILICTSGVFGDLEVSKSDQLFEAMFFDFTHT